MKTTSGVIDPHRPWIQDERDDPGRMDWVQTLFNPFGETSKVHFTRAWTVFFMGRLLLYVVPSFAVGILTVAGAKMGWANAPVNLLLITVPALLVPFAIYTFLTEFTSFVAHTRRLAEAKRPAWLAVIVLVPMILGLLAYTAGTGMGAAQHRMMTAPPPAAVKTEAEKEGAADGEGEEAKSEEAASASAKKQQRPQRRGPPGPPPSERQMAVQTGMSMGLPIWALGSLGVMLWTLLYVARLPNGGTGRISTGSNPLTE
jgi:fluoride ion exporter CrcB/FEX